MRTTLLFCAIGMAFALPAFAAGGGGHGGGGGFGGGHGMGLERSSMSMGHLNNPDTHGATVSQTAHDAKFSGEKVGPQVREVAKSNSQGSTGEQGHLVNPDTHGAAVSAAAHDAKLSGGKVGPQVRDAARSKSQGPSHANSRAISAVNGSHGKGGSNSVLGTGGSSIAATTGTKAHHGH